MCDMRLERNSEVGSHHHHHLICLDCGKVLSFEGDMLESMENKIKESMGFESLDHEVKLYGHCRECQKKGFPNNSNKIVP